MKLAGNGCLAESANDRLVLDGQQLKTVRTVLVDDLTASNRKLAARYIALQDRKRAYERTENRLQAEREVCQSEG